MPPDEPREIELKLLVRRQDRPALERHPLLKPNGASEERDELTTYFDTPRLALAEKGFSLRVRRSGNKRIQTLKSARDGRTLAKSPGEWEWVLDGDAPDLARVGEIPLAADVLAETADELEPVFRTQIRRSVRYLDLANGAVIEAAFDEGKVTSGAAAQDVSELELELKQGSPGSLYRLALELHGLAPFTIGAESKAERGRRLWTGETPRAVESQPPELRRDEPAETAFRQIITAELGHLLANQPAAAAGDVEGVHQMRVGIRRLRTALVLFGKHLDRTTTGRWDGELKRLGRVFGAARDWDVFCTETLTLAKGSKSSREWADKLRAPAEVKRKVAHEAMQEELGQPCRPSSHRLHRAIAKLAPELLDRMARKVEKRAGHWRRGSAKDLHGFRKTLKKLRYSVDYLCALYPAKQVRSYQKAANQLLKLLGAANDATVASSLAERLCKSNRNELGLAVASMKKWNAQRAAQARRKLPKAWSAFATESPIWR